MCRQLFGKPRSPISQITWCAVCGSSVQKSHCISLLRRLFLASRFCDRMKFWKCIGSLTKKTGVSLPTMS